jgi:SAM-dependent methyltransferase
MRAICIRLSADAHCHFNVGRPPFHRPNPSLPRVNPKCCFACVILPLFVPAIIKSFVMGSGTIQGELWGLAAERWANEQERTARPLWLDVLDALDARPGMHLFDAGCGSGAGSVDAVGRGCRVTGADASEALIAVARRRLPEARFDVCDLESLPYEDASFDATMAINSVFYCEDQAAAMRELCRVTRRGGRVAVTAWGPTEECEMRDIFAATSRFMPPPPPGASTGPALSEPGALEQSLISAGLTPCKSGRSGCPFEYDDVDSAWSAQSASGPVQRAIRTAGEVPVRRAFCDAAANYAQPDGRVVFQNVFLWAIGERH